MAPSSLAERSLADTSCRLGQAGKAGGYGLPGWPEASPREPGKTGQGKPPRHHQNQGY